MDRLERDPRKCDPRRLAWRRQRRPRQAPPRQVARRQRDRSRHQAQQGALADRRKNGGAEGDEVDPECQSRALSSKRRSRCTNAHGFFDFTLPASCSRSHRAALIPVEGSLPLPSTLPCPPASGMPRRHEDYAPLAISAFRPGHSAGTFPVPNRVSIVVLAKNGRPAFSLTSPTPAP